jgi:two-component system sensor histidine kinase KdpD
MFSQATCDRDGVMSRNVRGVLIGLALVVVVTAILELLDAELTVASLVLLATVSFAAIFGPAAMGTAVIAATVVLDLRFTAPKHSLRIDRGDDLGAVIVFAITAVLLGWLVHTLMKVSGELRRDEVEARLRFGLTSQLLQGGKVADALQETATTLRDVFDLDRCVLRVGAIVVDEGRAAGEPDVSYSAGDVQVDAYARGPLDDRERTHLEALVVQIETAIDQQRLQQEMRQTQLVAEVSQQRAGFLSAISHNLRTPLTAIKAAAGALLASWSRMETEERRELLETISDEAERLERLVRNTLELSRIRAGALEFEPQPVAIGDLVQHAVRRLRPISRAHRVRLALADDLPPVSLDVTMAEQIFLNLLENALRFAPPGSEILVGVRATERDIELRVSDHGPGVPPEAQSRIFEEFQSVDTRPDHNGTGLGLAIVRSLVRAHGGTVHYEDTEGGGATFVCTFPREEEAA